MKFETMSGSKYHIVKTAYGIFLIRNSNHSIVNIERKKIKGTKDVIYELKYIPNIVVGSSAIFEIVNDEKIVNFVTSVVISSSIF